ncbi:hypothetical protein [Inquilinus sp. Marseille-Q2685]|uniref:hypothetical protein n=1 Tax=Inquilinus sp. Marseille-Q2685 TaxID=2866581 RepID=UPI001CE46EA1|nr:hypothetical protein [Inquilinus sp. Marseille-Q2685]
MDKAQTDRKPEGPPTPQEERAARRLRVLDRLVEIGLEIAEATRTEAVEAPQPGVDYCQRFAVVARAVRLTVLLEEKLSRPDAEAEARLARLSVKDWHRHRVKLAVAAAIREETGTSEETHRRCAETLERLEQPELAEMIDRWPAEIVVARLCRMFGLPPKVERWLDDADNLLEDEEPPPEDLLGMPPGKRPDARRRRPPDTG